MNDHIQKVLFRRLTLTTDSVSFNTLGILRPSLINFSQYVDGKKLGELNNTALKKKKKNEVRMELWAEFNRLGIIRGKCTALFLGSKTQT